jgi:N6-L-threonylcarbamoyladenine synthase
MALILGIETSCDDTCAAVVESTGAMRSNVISSQHVHDRFGGVVPEVASRHHLQQINAVIDTALGEAGVGLDDIGRIAVTQGPGLIGALLVGLSTAKGLAAARSLPLAAIDHLHGHVAANFLDIQASMRGTPKDGLRPFDPPFLCLIASGGHTLLAHVRDHEGFTVLGTTLDDAAGEAFDKGARMLGLGFPGGAALERLAADGDPTAYEFPVAGRRGRPGAGHREFSKSLDFSFAGVKTALWQRLAQIPEAEHADRAPDLAASYQEAIVAALCNRVQQALAQTGLQRLAIGGGVAANGVLRARLRQLGVEVHTPPISLCTDNAAMIAAAACFVAATPYPDYLSLDAFAGGERPSSRPGSGSRP